MIEQAFATVLRRKRLAGGLSQEDLAQRAGLHRTYVSQLERNLKSPSLRTIHRLARVLDTTASELLAEVEKEMSRVRAQ